MDASNTNRTQTMQRTVSARIPTSHGEFQLYHFRNHHDDKEHLAIVMGNVAEQENVLVRVHSECFTGDVLGSRRCDCGEQLALAMTKIATEGHGIILYLRQEGRGIGLEEKLKAYNLQDQGYDTVEANLLLGHQADERQYWAAAGILNDLGVRSIRLITNNPDKLEKLAQEGIAINGTVALQPQFNDENLHYLRTKVEKMRHMLSLPSPQSNGHKNGYSTVHTENTNGISNDSFSILQAKHNQRDSTVADSAIEQQLALLQSKMAAHNGSLPFVTLTWAQSIDGSIAGKAGEPLRLSAEGAMRVTHRMRAMHDAILVGVGTVLADNPRLTTRLVEGPSPRPIIVDSHLRTPSNMALFDHPQKPLFATLETTQSVHQRIESCGGEILQLPAAASGGVELEALLVQLAIRGIRSVMVEGGARILSSFFTQKLGNAAIITIAPRLVGGLRVLQSNESLSNTARFDYTQIDGDLILWGELSTTK